jgi:hypothetical protein
MPRSNQGYAPTVVSMPNEHVRVLGDPVDDSMLYHQSISTSLMKENSTSKEQAEMERNGKECLASRHHRRLDEDLIVSPLFATND